MHACMASPIWKAIWSAGTLTCTTLPCSSLMYSPAALSGQGTSCPCFIYMALASPACVDCLMRSPFQISPPGTMTCPTLPRSLPHLHYISCAGQDALRGQGRALTLKRRVQISHQAACEATPASRPIHTFRAVLCSPVSELWSVCQPHQGGCTSVSLPEPASGGK